jgi:hypothetical protein
MEDDMRARTLLTTIAVLSLASAAMAGTVTLTLDCPQAPETQDGNITWTITATVSTGDNFGLALISTDLVQDPANPALFDLAPATDVPVAMENFSRPAGITNPPETDPVTGYMGVLRGPDGQKNVIQIGGAQNTFGATLPPATGMAQSDTVVTGVGHTPLVIATGEITLPAEGIYTFSLANPIANLLETESAFWSVVPADSFDMSGASFTITLGPPFCPGDLDCSGRVDFDDIDPFVAALGCSGGDPNCWPPSTMPHIPADCPWRNGDCNEDGEVNFDDIDPFVARIGATCP